MRGRKYSTIARVDSSSPVASRRTVRQSRVAPCRIIPMRNLLTEIPAVVLSDGDKERVLHGMDLNLLTSAFEAPEYRLMDQSGEFLAIAERLQTFTSPVPQPVKWVRAHPKIIFA